jgi:hypothetical protein
MTDANPSRLGQINAGGATDALYLKLFGGEVMTAFEQATVFLNHHFVQSISSGKSKQFPMLGRTTAAYHTVGAELLGNVIAHNERVITVDDMLVAHTFVADWDEMVNHYEVRSKYSKEIGAALGQKFDKTIAQVAVLAARASSPITGENGGSVLTDANYATSGAALAAALFDAKVIFDESEVTGTPRLFIRPAQHALMAETTSILNKDWGGAGSFSQGTVGPVNGIEIIKSNNVPSTNVNSGPSKYQGNFSTTVGVFMTDMAVGTVKLQNVAIGTQYQLNRLGTLTVGRLAFGSGILRPICAIELKTS